MNREKLYDILVDVLGCDELDLSDSTSLKDDLLADEIDMSELAMYIEDERDVEISDEELERCSTIGSIVSLLKIKKVWEE